MTRRDPHGPMWKNRIVGQGEEAPDQLLANPANGWKIHTEEQQDEVEKIIETVGWVRKVLVNRRTNHVVDGHLRVQLAMRRGEETVPVEYIDISLAEEQLLIATLDPVSAMIGRDKDKLDELLDDVRGAFATAEINFDAIFQFGKTKTKGLTHEVNACQCCTKKCKAGCGCYTKTE